MTFLYRNENEQLIIKPKETYNGTIPSGNSVMCYNLLKLSSLHHNRNLGEQQLTYMAGQAEKYPGGFCMRSACSDGIDISKF